MVIENSKSTRPDWQDIEIVGKPYDPYDDDGEFISDDALSHGDVMVIQGVPVVFQKFKQQKQLKANPAIYVPFSVNGTNVDVTNAPLFTISGNNIGTRTFDLKQNATPQDSTPSDVDLELQQIGQQLVCESYY